MLLPPGRFHCDARFEAARFAFAYSACVLGLLIPYRVGTWEAVQPN